MSRGRIGLLLYTTFCQVPLIQLRQAFRPPVYGGADCWHDRDTPTTLQDKVH
ncbi:MAG: hypothetical protein ACUVQO_22985 [Leptodesmis sp.]